MYNHLCCKLVRVVDANIDNVFCFYYKADPQNH